MVSGARGHQNAPGDPSQRREQHSWGRPRESGVAAVNSSQFRTKRLGSPDLSWCSPSDWWHRFARFRCIPARLRLDSALLSEFVNRATGRPRAYGLEFLVPQTNWGGPSAKVSVVRGPALFPPCPPASVPTSHPSILKSRAGPTGMHAAPQLAGHCCDLNEPSR